MLASSACIDSDDAKRNTSYHYCFGCIHWCISYHIKIVLAGGNCFICQNMTADVLTFQAKAIQLFVKHINNMWDLICFEVSNYQIFVERILRVFVTATRNMGQHSEGVKFYIRHLLRIVLFCVCSEDHCENHFRQKRESIEMSYQALNE